MTDQYLLEVLLSDKNQAIELKKKLEKEGYMDVYLYKAVGTNE